MCRRISAAAVLLVVSVVPGCGAGDSAGLAAVSPGFGPHGGPLAALTSEVFAEVVIEPAGSAPAVPRHRVVAYFYGGPGLSAPPAQAPEAVRFVLETPDAGSVPLDLGAEPGPSAGGAARYASAPGPFAVDPIFGTLHATVGGAAVTTAVACPR